MVRDDWWLAPGAYHVLVGRSAEDIRAEAHLQVVGEPPALRRLTESAVAAAAFDAQDGALLVPCDANAGSAVTGRSPSAPFSLDFERCALDGARALEVTVRAPDARRGWVELLTRGDSGAWLRLGRVTPLAHDQEQLITLELPGDGPPVVALRLRVSPGLLVCEFRAE